MNPDLKKNFRPVTPYTPGEKPESKDIIKLNTNENPYPPSPSVVNAFREVSPDTFRLYPDTDSTIIINAAAKCYGLKENRILAANGSDDALALCFMALFNSKKPVLFPDITYSFFPVWCTLFDIPYKTMPLNAEFKITPRDYTIDNGGIILANPNAPTGISLPKKDIRIILENNPDVAVILDEAYVDFGGDSVTGMINEYDNLVVVHTFSKYRSLAGMRIGLVMAHHELIDYLTAIKNSYNTYPLDRAAQAVAAAALADNKYYKNTAAIIKKTREDFSKELKKLGFKLTPSSANFVFATHDKARAADIYEFLKEKNIYVRYFNLPRIDNHLRITIGTPEQMRITADALEEFLKK